MASRKRLLAIAATALVALAGSITLAFLATYYYLKPTLPDVAALKDLKLQVPLRVYSRDGRLIGQIGEQRRVPVKYEEIPQVVVHAVLAAEDDRFFEHPGVDWQGMARATVIAMTTMQMSQGGSTLTQQLVRSTLITKERRIRRKLREIFLSLALENELSKQEIFALFVNTQFLGQRAYGFASAAETYFGKRLEDLDVAEAALLAGILQAPSRYNPAASPKLAEKRRAYVLRRMQELDYIDEPTYKKAMAKPVSGEMHGPGVEVDAPYVAELVRISLAPTYGDKLYSAGYRVVTTVDSRLQRAADVALRSTVLEYDRRHGYRGPAGHVKLPSDADGAMIEEALDRHPVVGGLLPAIVTGLSDNAVRVATRSRGRFTIPLESMKWARRGDGKGGVGAPVKKAGDVLKRGDIVYVLPDSPGTALLTQLPDVQGAFVALDPSDGAIVAMAGGFDYYTANFNRVTQARRQPGSAFKPFIYSAALERGFTPATVILDAPVVYESGEAGDWRPENSEGRFYGPTRMRDALARSRNLVSIRIMRSLGLADTLAHVERFGFPSSQLPRDLTMALGTASLTPLEVATGFAAFANGGYRVKPYLIDRVEDSNGTVLMQAEPLLVCRSCYGTADSSSPPPLTVAGDGTGVTRAADVHGSLPQVASKQRAPSVISAANAFIITDMMRDVIRRGTGRRALALNRSDIAGKTGTTNDRRDAWFSGFNASLVGTAWVGFDQSHSLGANEEGGRTALPMWVYFMQEALRGMPDSRLPMPEGVVTARVSPTTGLLAGADESDAMFEYFLAEHLPAAGAAGSAGETGTEQGPAAETQKPSEEPLF